MTEMTKNQRIEEMRADRTRINMAAQGIKNVRIWVERSNPRNRKCDTWIIKSEKN